MKKLLLVLFLSLIGIFLINQSGAMLTSECSDSSYVFANSAVVVNGTIKNVETNRINGTTVTTLIIDVEKYGKGSGESEIIIKVFGGKIGNEVMNVEDTPLFTKEDIEVKGEFFLYNDSAGEFRLFCGEWNKIDTKTECNVDNDCKVKFSSCSCSNGCILVSQESGIDCKRLCSDAESNLSITSCKCENDKCVGKQGEQSSDCKNLYWFDNENKECGKKEFCTCDSCGTYMYEGLETFESKTQCLKASEDYCSNDSDCEVRFSTCSCSNGCVLTTEDSNVDCARACLKRESNLSITLCKCENKKCVEKQERVQECQVDFDCKVSECQRKCINVNLVETLRYCGEKGFPDSCVCTENKCKGNKHLSNGRKAEIKIMPETASEKAIERLGDLGFDVSLKEVGGDKVAYELVGEKEGRMLGLFKIKGRVSIQVDAETGEVLKVGKPWWAFLASGI